MFRRWVVVAVIGACTNLVATHSIAAPDADGAEDETGEVDGEGARDDEDTSESDRAVSDEEESDEESPDEEDEDDGEAEEGAEPAPSDVAELPRLLVVPSLGFVVELFSLEGVTVEGTVSEPVSEERDELSLRPDLDVRYHGPLLVGRLDTDDDVLSTTLALKAISLRSSKRGELDNHILFGLRFLRDFEGSENAFLVAVGLALRTRRTRCHGLLSGGAHDNEGTPDVATYENRREELYGIDVLCDVALGKKHLLTPQAKVWVHGDIFLDDAPRADPNEPYNDRNGVRLGTSLSYFYLAFSHVGFGATAGIDVKDVSNLIVRQESIDVPAQPGAAETTVIQTTLDDVDVSHVKTFVLGSLHLRW